jgi:nucleoside-diphosphate-sugar epimerase
MESKKQLNGIKKTFKKKILILCCSGYLGSSFTNYIKNENKFLVYTTTRKNLRKLRNFKCNLLDLNKLKKIIKKIKPNIIINFSGGFKNKFKTDILNNLIIHQNIFLSIIENKLKKTKIILLNSAAEFGISQKNSVKEFDKKKPFSLYGLGKKMQLELSNYYFNKYRLNINNIRLFNIIPSNKFQKNSIFSQLEKKIKKYKKKKTFITIGSSKEIRDYEYEEKLLKQILKIIIHGLPGQTYNIGSGKPSKIGNIAKKYLILKGVKDKYIILSKKRFNSFGASNSFYANINKFKKL